MPSSKKRVGESVRLFGKSGRKIFTKRDVEVLIEMALAGARYGAKYERPAKPNRRRAKRGG
jgi:hypothetical protein